MKSLLLKKFFLTILIVSMLSIGLTGCLEIVAPPSETETGTIKIVVSGTNSYNLTMDGVTRFSNKQPGTYTLTKVPVGNHNFEAIDVRGSSYGYESVTQNISTGTNYVYLEPQSTPRTGTVYIVLSGDEKYDLKMDGTTYFSNRPAATYTLINVPVGNHTFEAIDIWGSSWGYDSETEYISAGSNYIYLNP
jgi:hypothetical protein